MRPRERSRAVADRTFVRDDETSLQVVEGFRERVLSAPRVSVQPKPSWTADDFEAAAEKKLSGSRRLLGGLERCGDSLEGARVLDVGAGAGIDSLLLALHGAERVVGIDLDFPLLEDSDRGRWARRLTRTVLRRLGVRESIDDTFGRLPVELVCMDATRMSFADASFDLVVSRAALEHVRPIERGLAEMERVVTPGGLLHHGIDQFFWLKGCHKGGLVDLPWAHARLTADEYRRFVAETEGTRKAEKRSRHLTTLNQLGLRQWRALFEARFDVVEWKETRNELAAELLAEHPDVRETMLPGVTERDLVHSSIKVWSRSRGR
jgi:ubiquinone/menaquinone biosynthesis C-methylase UbiE